MGTCCLHLQGRIGYITTVGDSHTHTIQIFADVTTPSSMVMKEVADCYVKLVTIYQTTQRHISEDSITFTAATTRTRNFRQHILMRGVWKWLSITKKEFPKRTYSKPSLIWMSDNLDWSMKNVVHSRVHTLKDTWHIGRHMSHLFVQTKLDSFFKPTLWN
jgi:hypothetical protein